VKKRGRGKGASGACPEKESFISVNSSGVKRMVEVNHSAGYNEGSE